jgi:hypothetical protein
MPQTLGDRPTMETVVILTLLLSWLHILPSKLAYC